MKIMCLDVGTVRIGIATSDEMNIIASPHSVYKRRTPYLDSRHIAELAEQVGAKIIVFGLPLKLDGTEGPSAVMARELAERVKTQTDLPIEFQDERLSTVSAERILIETGNRRDNRKDKIDAVAASIILQNYIDKKFHK